MRFGRGRHGWGHGRLRELGYRLTVPRQVILDILGNAEGHPSAEEIYLQAHSVYPNIGLTTVYRTLDLLVRMGLVHKLDFGDRRARYEIARGPDDKEHHHHIICTNCGKVIDYNDFFEEETELIKKTEQGLAEKFNFKVTNHLIQFYGLCSECQKKQECT